MTHELALLAATAAGIGFLHALLGPDHYLPFVLMGRAGRWSRGKTLAVTFVCGLGHVGTALALAGLGVALGLASARLAAIESFRGQLAVWALIGFGLVYFAWGLRRGGGGRARRAPPAPRASARAQRRHCARPRARPRSRASARAPGRAPARARGGREDHPPDSVGPVHALHLRPLRAAHPAGAGAGGRAKRGRSGAGGGGGARVRASAGGRPRGAG